MQIVEIGMPPVETRTPNESDFPAAKEVAVEEDTVETEVVEKSTRFERKKF